MQTIFGKIFLIGVLLILISSRPGLTQKSVTWDSTSRPAVYEPLVEQFRTFPPGRKNTVLLGNSITFWGDWAERLGNKIKNQGIPGDNTYGVLDRIQEVVQNKPSRVLILIGINDLAASIPDSIILLNYARIIDRIHTGSPATKIYFQTLLPTNASFRASVNHKEKNVLKINAALKVMANDKKIGFIDLYSHFTDSSGALAKDYTWDGVHLNQRGYDQWVRILKKGGYLK